MPQAEEAPNTDDQVIWSVLAIKRRLSAYLPLPGVLRIFPDVKPPTLCELADLKTVRRGFGVLAIVPKATMAQLCDFCELTESFQAPDNAVVQPRNISDPQPAQNESGPVADLLRELQKLKPRFAWVLISSIR